MADPTGYPDDELVQDWYEQHFGFAPAATGEQSAAEVAHDAYAVFYWRMASQPA